MKMSESVKTISQALVKVQKQMESVTKDASNPYYKSKYADINSFLQVAVPALNSQGLTILQPTYSKDENHYVETTLLHESGEYITSEPLKLVLTKPDMQQLGSAITYGRRYQLQSLLGMMAEDDDANLATGKKPLETKTPSPSKPVEPPKVEAAPVDAPKTNFRGFKPKTNSDMGF